MRVAMVESGGWGGIGHYAWNLCEALAEAGAEVTLLTSTAPELGARPRRFAVEPVLDGRRRFPTNAGRLLARLAAHDPHVVHLQSLLSTRLDWLLWPWVARRRPLVITAHNVRSHEGPGWESFTLWRCLRHAAAVVVHTREAAAVAARRLPRTPIEVIRHGDYAFFGEGGGVDRAAARRALGLPSEGRIVLAFGAIRPYKGLRELIQTLPAVRRRLPTAHLVVAGPLLVGTAEEYLAAARAAGVEAAVTFRPCYVPHEQVAAYFRAADVAVYNYRDVTDSGSLRIAASLGVPIVATAVGGFRELLGDGETARLVAAGDGVALAEALAEVLGDPALAARLAANARALARSAWSWADGAKATLALYERVRRAV